MAKSWRLQVAEQARYLQYAGMNLPRYTSYPSIPQWKDQAGLLDFKQKLDETVEEQKAFSLYFHVPFCQKLCFYCGCHKEIMNPAADKTQAFVEQYLAGLEKEVARIAHHLDHCVIEQIHFGGGTPNFLNPQQWQRLHENILSRFTISEEAEFSVEIDPRTITPDHLMAMRDSGVNRLSMGIQDFDPKVQKAVNRMQSYELVAELMQDIRQLGIPFVNFDLIYGLPFQTLDSMRETIAKVIALQPDRIAYYRLAVLPQMFSAQQSFIDKDLPEGEASLALNLLGINSFLQAGYEFIGLDHFAKKEDPLSVAARKDALQRNFQGMTTGANLPLLGFGPSAISMFDRFYVQNPKGTDEWLRTLDDHDFTRKACLLTDDDLLRREVINQIFCHQVISKGYIESFFDCDFDQRFTREAKRLLELEQEGLIRQNSVEIQLTDPLGLLLRRVVAAVFDAYLPVDATRQGMGSQRASQVG